MIEHGGTETQREEKYKKEKLRVSVPLCSKLKRLYGLNKLDDLSAMGFSIRKLLSLLWVLVCFSSLVRAEQADTLYNQSFDWVSGQRESLPGWVFTSQEAGRIVAASDPCLKPQVAREQAIQRALYLYSLQQGATVQLLSDYFSSVETEKNTYEDVSDKMLVMAVIRQPTRAYSYRIVNEYTSLFGEYYVQVVISPESGEGVTGCGSCQSVSELMLTTSKERREGMEVRLQLNVESTYAEQTSQWQFSAKGEPENLTVGSFVNGNKLMQSGRGCWYTNTLTPPSEAISIPLKTSFWSAYITSFLKALLMHPFPNVKVKRVNEGYGEGSERNKDLHRESTVSTVSVTSCVKGIMNNELHVDWQIKSGTP